MRAALRRLAAAITHRATSLERRANAVLPDPLKLGALTLYLHTSRGVDRLDALAARRFWDRWTDAGVVALLLLQVGGLGLVAVGAWSALGRETATALNDPANVVAVPGLNEFMPIAAAPYVVVALVAATVVHEGGHAVACRRAGVPVVEVGVALLLGVLPVAAYVLPGEELDAAPTRAKLRVYAVGVFHNVLLALLAYGVLLSPVTASPRVAFVAYFGWALVGGSAPTAATVAGLGVLTNLAFWLALLNANFGLLNALPVAALDGGRVLDLVLGRIANRAGVSLSDRARTLAVHGAGVAAAVLVAVAIVGPWLPG